MPYPGPSSYAAQADVALRNKKGDVPFMVASKAGHDNVKEKLQPVRHNLLTQMKEINTAEQFHEARRFVKDYGLYRLKHEMGAPPPRRDIGTAPSVSTQAREHPALVSTWAESELRPTLTSPSHPSSRARLRGQGYLPAHDHEEPVQSFCTCGCRTNGSGSPGGAGRQRGARACG